MFEFEKLVVYTNAKTFNTEVLKLMSENPGLDGVTRNQLRRAAYSILLNIAEVSFASLSIKSSQAEVIC